MKAFDVICPAEWVRVDPAQPDEDQIREIAREYGLRAYPEFREQVSAYAAQRWFSALAQLRDEGAVVVFFAGPRSPASILQAMVAIRPLIWPEDIEPLVALASQAGSDPHAQVFDLDTAVALRSWTQTDVTGEAAQKAAADLPENLRSQADTAGVTGSTQFTLTYRIGLPDDREAWVEAYASAFSPTGAPIDGLQEQITAMFDSVLSTFTWVES